jgi:hypothetical protein
MAFAVRSLRIYMSESESNYQRPLVKTTLREMVTDAIRYWEPRRLAYNGVLAAIVIAYFCMALSQSRSALSVNGILFLIILTVLANLCYCAAYVADVFAQFSGFRDVWLRWRWVLFTVGVAFAGIITRFFALAFFSSSHAG